MKVKAVKIDTIISEELTLEELLDKYLASVKEETVLAISSKVVSLCEGSTVPIGEVDKKELIKRNSEYYLPKKLSKYGYNFTITRHTLISAAGIDESNGANHYVLWSKDPQETANSVRAYLLKRFNLKRVGVVITDSVSTPLRLGTTGICVAYSGFKPINDYVGLPDLFGRPFAVSKANVAGGLAAAAVLVMGEGTEKTPLILLTDLASVVFVDKDPTQEEIDEVFLNKDDDLFAPFLNSQKWRRGNQR